MERFGFKQYLDSCKKQLSESMERTPVITYNYHVKKYCTLMTGESKETKTPIQFKPKDTMKVSWKMFEGVSTPKLNKIIVDNEEDIDDHEYVTYWTDEKLIKWLTSNTIKQPLL